MSLRKSPCINDQEENKLCVSITPTPSNMVGVLNDAQAKPITTKQESKTHMKKVDGIFAEITHEMVTYASKNVPEAVNWVQNGEAFIVDSSNIKLGPLLTSFFRHARYSSFQRQLNMYGFKKCVKGKYAGAFHHPLFHRDDNSSFTLSQIKRRPPPNQNSRSSRSKRRLVRPQLDSNSNENNNKRNAEFRLRKRSKSNRNESFVTVVCNQDVYIRKKLSFPTTTLTESTPKCSRFLECSSSSIISKETSCSLPYGINETPDIESDKILNDPISISFESFQTPEIDKRCHYFSPSLSSGNNDNRKNHSTKGYMSPPMKCVFGARVGLDEKGHMHVDYTPSKKHAFFMSPIVKASDNHVACQENAFEYYEEFNRDCIEPFDRIFDNWTCDNNIATHATTEAEYPEKYAV